MTFAQLRDTRGAHPYLFLGGVSGQAFPDKIQTRAVLYMARQKLKLRVEIENEYGVNQAPAVTLPLNSIHIELLTRFFVVRIKLYCEKPKRPEYPWEQTIPIIHHASQLDLPRPMAEAIRERALVHHAP